MFSYGRLTLSDENKVIDFTDEEFGCLYIPRESASPSYLFANLASAKHFTQINPADYSLTPLGKKEFPAILSTTADENTISIYTTLSKQHPMLARKMPQHPGILEVIQFESTDNRRDDMPETGEAISITAKGYILEQNVQKQDRTEIFKPVIGPIFANRDLIKDVQQYSFGDCFLLASILAILNSPNGSDNIKSLMIQDGDHTIVKLFDPNTLTPIFIRVQNSIYHRNNNIDVKHEALWVHILEKAYTAIAFKKEKSTTEAKNAFPAFREIFGDGGHSATALTILTGQSSHLTKMKEDESDYPWSNENISLCIPTYLSTLSMKNYFKEVEIAKIDAYLTQHKDSLIVSNAVDELLSILNKSSNTEDLTDTRDVLKNYIEKYNQIWCESGYPIKAFTNLSQMAVIGKYLLEAGNNSFSELKESITDSRKAKEYLEKLAKRDPSFPTEALTLFSSTDTWNAPLGDGKYNEKTNAIFDDLTEKLKNNYLLVAGSRSTLPEESATGLRPKHAYAITGTHVKTINGKNLKFIKVRNPWGHTGKQYHWENIDKDKSVSTEKRSFAEFDVELSDFVKSYSHYSTGEFTTPSKLTPAEHISLNDPNREKSTYKPEKSFFARHWKKILIGAIAVTAVTVIIGLTLGLAAPAIAFGSLGLIIGIKALIAVKASIVVGSAAAGAVAGATTGVISDKINNNSTTRALRAFKRSESKPENISRIPENVIAEVPAVKISHADSILEKTAIEEISYSPLRLKR